MDYLDPGMAARDKGLQEEGRQIGRGPNSPFVKSKIDSELEELSNSRRDEYIPWTPKHVGRRRRRKKKKKSGLPQNFLPMMSRKSKRRRRRGRRRKRRGRKRRRR